MSDISLSQAVTQRFQASILLPSLPPPPPQVIRSSAPPPQIQEPTRAEQEADRRAREAEENSSFRSGFLVQERISLSAEALQLRQTLNTDEVTTAPPIAVPETIARPQPNIDIAVSEPIAAPAITASRDVQSVERAAVENRSDRQTSSQSAQTSAAARSVDAFA